ncbi:MAG: hypothetical protein KME46_01180 [Brasilonema angustatum HA4187-MV1]|jgi:hypothetical protein|nr:hypothetical protein [Brasilonema angustatum HA4187-MV1]
MKVVKWVDTFLLTVTLVSVQTFANQTLATTKLKQHLDTPYSQMTTGQSLSTDQQITRKLNPSTVIASQINSVFTNFQTYVENKVYSISYPLGWFFTRSCSELAYITNLKMAIRGGGKIPQNFIKTDVQIISEKIQTTFTENLSYSEENGERLVKKENINVDGKNGMRMWYSSGETETMITLLPYKDNNTACITTFYTRNNSNYIPIFEKIHSSFKVLS